MSYFPDQYVAAGRGSWLIRAVLRASRPREPRTLSRAVLRGVGQALYLFACFAPAVALAWLPVIVEGR